MSKEIEKKLTEEETKELSVLSGEENFKTPKKIETPVIKLNGKDGKFYKTTKTLEDKYEKEEILEEYIEGTILKIRRTLTAYRQESGVLCSLFTNQHNSWRDDVLLFETSEGEKTKMVDSGSVPDIRKKYPELRVSQEIYFLLDSTKEIVKLVIKGKGLSSLYDFFTKLEKKEHSFEKIIRIDSKEEEGKLGSYYYNTFAVAGEVEDIALIQEKIKELSESIEEIESYYKKREEELLEKLGDGNIESPENKTDEVPGIDEEEIDVNDIPF